MGKSRMEEDTKKMKAKEERSIKKTQLVQFSLQISLQSKRLAVNIKGYIVRENC